MIKVFLKHKIFEYCINVIFNTIQKNFYKQSTFLRVGEVYSKIKTSNYLFNGDIEEKEYKNCIITDATEHKVFGEVIFDFMFKPKNYNKPLLGYFNRSVLIK